MKLWRLLTLPGYALSKTARLLWLGLGAPIAGVTILIFVLTHNDTLGWTLRTAQTGALLEACLWVLLANTVLLARHARTLRLPTLERDAIVSLGLYGVLGVALPALLLGWAGGHLLAAAIMLLFGAGLGAAFALLPTYLAVFALFAANIPGALSPWLPQAMQPGFNAWAGPLVVLLWLALAWRIRELLRGKHSLQSPHGPMLIVFRRTYLWLDGGAGSKAWGIRTPGNGAAWAQPKIDLSGCGPAHLERSLRVALGGWWMPQTRLSRMWQCVLIMGGLSLGALFLLTQAAADQHDRAGSLITDLGGTGSVIFFGMLMSGLVAITTVRLLYGRWGKTNAELPLLALLPGLGNGVAVKYALLRASLLPALGVQLGLALLLVIVAGITHLGSEGEALLLLGPLGSSALVCAFALVVFGANPMRGWGMALAMTAGYVWIGVSWGIVQSNASPVVVLSATSLLVLAMGWSMFVVAMLWLGLRGWHGLQQRPHPFLVD